MLVSLLHTAPGLKMEEVAKRLRCVTILQKELSEILQRMIAGAARRIFLLFYPA